jgi:hypothetical protein
MNNIPSLRRFCGIVRKHKLIVKESMVMQWCSPVNNFFPRFYCFFQSDDDFKALLDNLSTPPLFTTLRINTQSISKEEIAQQLQSVLNEVISYI